VDNIKLSPLSDSDCCNDLPVRPHAVVRSIRNRLTAVTIKGTRWRTASEFGSRLRFGWVSARILGGFCCADQSHRSQQRRTVRRERSYPTEPSVSFRASALLELSAAPSSEYTAHAVGWSELKHPPSVLPAGGLYWDLEFAAIGSLLPAVWNTHNVKAASMRYLKRLYDLSPRVIQDLVPPLVKKIYSRNTESNSKNLIEKNLFLFRSSESRIRYLNYRRSL
jgi:hypothetical protein